LGWSPREPLTLDAAAAGDLPLDEWRSFITEMVKALYYRSIGGFFCSAVRTFREGCPPN
jgi:hypothetical protein